MRALLAWGFILAIVGPVLAACGEPEPAPTPRPTALGLALVGTPVAVASPAVSPIVKAVPTSVATPSVEPAVTPTRSPTGTPVPTATPTATPEEVNETNIPLTLPAGFRISLFTPQPIGPIRFMAFSPDGIQFVSMPSRFGLYSGDRSEGTVFAMPDRDQDGRADEVTP